VLLQLSAGAPVFSLATRPDLARLLRWESGAWSSLLLAFWSYVQDHELQDEGDDPDHELQDEDDKLYLRLDGPLQKCSGGVSTHSTSDRLMEARVPIHSISDRLKEMASEQGPVVLEHRLTLHGDAAPSVFEVVVTVPDPITEEVRSALASEEEARTDALEADRIDQQVARLREEITQHTRRGAFFSALADNPAAFLHTATAALAEDGVVRRGGRPE
ncbi:hypothetical protein T484DRAFT_1802766, partial [Baffinella frigidus]